MPEPSTVRPAEAEYAESYGKYIRAIPGGDILLTLTHQLDETLALLGGISESQASSRYAPGKWSIKEVLGHVTDAERIFAHRALRFARADQTPLPRFDIDDYVRHGGFDSQRLHDLAEGFALVRRASVHLFRHLPDEAWPREGVANGKRASVRALAYLIAGHAAHHMETVRTKYLA